jgi:NodT family efflux transporter outer membrane factor (OMF) lipoprotein
VSWEADLFGRVENAVKAADANVQAVEAARDAVRVAVAAGTTRAYCNALAWAMARDIAAQSLEIAEKSLVLVTQKEQAGAANMLDVERAATAVENARAKIAPLEAKHKSALLELSAMLGQPPGHLPEAACLGTTPPSPAAALPVGDGATLLRNRPDLREAERKLASATAKIGVATADLYPTISLGASVNYFRNDYVRDNDSFTWALGPVPMISWRFPNQSLARARIHQAEARGEALLAAFDGKVVTALKEVEQALVNFSAEQDRLDTLAKARERAKKAWHIADMRYRAGSASWLEALTTQQDFLDARANYAASVQRVSSARVDLFKALGCGWKNAAPARNKL